MPASRGEEGWLYRTRLAANYVKHLRMTSSIRGRWDSQEESWRGAFMQTKNLYYYFQIAILLILHAAFFISCTGNIQFSNLLENGLEFG